MTLTSRLLCCALALLAVGCSRHELYASVSERQANEMVALLRSAGIDADKKRAEAGQYALRVAPGQFSEAVQLLHAQGYPRNENDTLGSVFKKDGFVTTQLEERARFMHALSQELATTLQSIDGVVVARVHLSVPEKRRFAEKPEAAAASVFLKVRAGKDLTPHVGSIKALVVNAIEGLPYEAVTVVTFPAEPWPGAAPLQAAGNPALASLGTPLVASAGVGGLALVAGGTWWGWQRRRSGRSRSLTQAGQAGTRG
jgi:type III secretion protein J